MSGANVSQPRAEDQRVAARPTAAPAVPVPPHYAPGHNPQGYAQSAPSYEQAFRGVRSHAQYHPQAQAHGSQAHAPSASQPGFGSLFRDLRRVLNLSLPAAAARLGTRMEVIAALEAGETSRLPPWPETARVVTAYTGLASINPAPVLLLIRRALDANAVPLASESEPEPLASKVEPPAAEQKRPIASHRLMFAALRPLGWPWWAPRLAGVRRLASTVSFGASVSSFGASLRERVPLDSRRLSAIGALLLVLAAAFAQGSALHASLATLHPPIANLVRGAQDYLLMRAAPVRQGLRWIEVDDPRTRRTNRLQLGRSS
ncbi:MAG: hypothetical protein WC807_15330 [Hyphomicrobium sp.]